VPVTPGDRLGSYEVTAALGAGGMGEVYRARDTQLDRDVALKILPPAFAADPDRLMRFEREAKTLAALNHPHIAQIHGIERSGGAMALVMELVEGPTLADRLLQGPLPLEEALPVAAQIAAALEAAHEQGIVHRDLKPANIKVRPDGTVKVLDFGLAKALGVGAFGADATSLANSPTMASPPVTAMGVILGTAAYMAPEQAKGRAVDRRADVWAFGVVLYEMLTGRALFAGEDFSDTLVAVLSKAPDWTLLPARTPPAARRLLARCLARDRRARLDSMAAARLDLEEAMAPADAPPVEAARRTGWLLPAALALGGLLAGALGAHWLTPAHPAGDMAGAARVISHIAATPEAVSAFTYGFALSPDATTLVYAARPADGRRQLWKRRLADARAEPMAGTEDGMYPFWSPDSRHVAFFAAGKLKRVPVDGGPALTITDAASVYSRGSWSVRDEILFNMGVGDPWIHLVPASGGAAARVPIGGVAWNLQWLPDGRHFLYSWTDGHTAQLYGAAVDAIDAPVRVLTFDQAAREEPGALYSAAGFLAFNRGGVLSLQRFDTATLATVGPAVPIGDPAGTPRSWFAVSAAGRVLVALNPPAGGLGGTPGDPISRLLWVDRSGRVTGQLGPEARYWTLRLSRDGQRVAINPDYDLWTIDARTGLRTRIGDASGAVWMPGDDALVYRGAGGLWIRPSSGEGEPRLLVASERGPAPHDVSPDGSRVVVTTRRDNGSDRDMWLVSVADGSTRPLVATEFDEGQASFSPDGRWIAYASNANGQYEVFARQVAGHAPAVQLSGQGGQHPFWRADGREVFFLSPTDEVVAVDVTALARTGAAGARQVLFRVATNDIVRESFPAYAVSPDGQRFLVNAPMAPEPLTLMQLPRLER
jgi:eukaryotic-like serine/threonine-protein kinase